MPDSDPLASTQSHEMPERAVLDDIDELIASELDENGEPRDDFTKDRYVKCEVCHEDWHGLTAENGCPGAFSDDDERKAWLARRDNIPEPYPDAGTDMALPYVTCGAMTFEVHCGATLLGTIWIPVVPQHNRVPLHEFDTP